MYRRYKINEFVVIELTGIWLGQKLHDGQQHLADGQCRRPVVLNNVQANNAVGINVAVIDARAERDLCMKEKPCYKP